MKPENMTEAQYVAHLENGYEHALRTLSDCKELILDILGDRAFINSMDIRMIGNIYKMHDRLKSVDTDQESKKE